MDYIGTFIKNAKSFARNPLSIIALFISLIYGFACLVLGISNSGLDKDQKWPLIWFIVVFPLIVLLAFVYLVVYHHKKLYAPSDYKDENNFFKTLDAEVQKERLTESVKALEHETNVPQDSKNESKEVPVSLRKESIRELNNKYFLAEELVLRQIEIEFGAVIKRQSGVEVGHELLPFDGIGTQGDKSIFVEVKYTRSGMLHRDTIKNFYNQVNKLRQYYATNSLNKLIFILAIVHEGSFKRIDEMVYEEFKESIVTPKVIYFNIHDLKSKFGIE